MRSRPEARLGFAIAALAVSLSLGAAQAPLPDAVPIAGTQPNRAQVEAALAKVKADPNLGTERTVKTLRWVTSSSSEKKDEPARRSRDPGWFSWTEGLFGWFAQSARALIWVAIGLVVALLVIYIARIVRERGVPTGSGAFVAPTHVQDLDIRPQSLPPDIGAAAFALWESGEHRAALALLYRGLLSRLANVHGVPIRHSSTEGDCLTLSAQHVSEERSAYASGLVRIWQRAVYGGMDAETPSVRALCEGFAAALDAPPKIADVRDGGTAGQAA